MQPLETILPVPVLADQSSSRRDGNERVGGGEALESTNTKLKRPVEQVALGTRGGQNLWVEVHGNNDSTTLVPKEAEESLAEWINNRDRIQNERDLEEAEWRKQ